MKTTVLGVLTIVATVANVSIQIISGGTPDLYQAFAAIAAAAAGLGLVKAADSK